MSNQSDIKAVLVIDATLLAVATGGIYTWSDTNRLGISRETVPSAFDTSAGLIKPCLLIKGRGERPDGGIADDTAQQVSTSEIVEVWFYEDTGYTNIEAMKSRVYVLLHGKQVASTGIFIARWAGDPFVQMRDDAMGHISVERSDYDIRSLKD
jgi:hypothetical protein